MRGKAKGIREKKDQARASFKVAKISPLCVENGGLSSCHLCITKKHPTYRVHDTYLQPLLSNWKDGFKAPRLCQRRSPSPHPVAKSWNIDIDPGTITTYYDDEMNPPSPDRHCKSFGQSFRRSHSPLGPKRGFEGK